MAARTGAGFRRRDACRARGPKVSTTVGASGWSAEIKWRGGRRGRDGRTSERGRGGKVRGVAIGTTPNPQRSRTPSFLSQPSAETGSQPPHTGRIIIYFPFISLSELHSYLSLSLFRLLPFCFVCRCHPWFLFFIRARNGVSSHGHFIEKQRLRSSPWFTSKDFFEGSAKASSSGCFLSFHSVSDFARSKDWDFFFL